MSVPYTSSPAPRAPSLALFVTSSPEEAAAGESVAFTVRLSNEGDAEVHGVVVSGTLPAGLECLDCRGFYSPGNRRLHWTFGSLSSGQVLTLTFAARVEVEAGWEEGVPLLLSARGVETPGEAKGTAVVRVPYPLPDGPAESVLRPGEGGELLSPDGRVRIVFPPEAVPVTLTVSYRPAGGDLLAEGHPSGRAAPSSQTGGSAEFLRPLRRFAVEVRDPSGQEVSSFPVPVEVSYRYTWAEALGRLEEEFFLAQWDRGVGNWVRLPTEVDRAGRTLRARVTHFSEILAGEGYIKLPSDDYLPSLQGFQEIDLFSGAASYSYPMEVPPGRGGLTPRLSLSYNSGGVDWPARPWDADVQASWVGYGWSLEVGSIGRQDVGGWSADCGQGSSPYSAGDVWSLSLNGAGYDLVKGADGYYHTSEETFFRIWNSGGGNPSAWYVRTKDGTLYTFGQPLWQVVYTLNPPSWDHQIYKWLLTEVRDVHGNTITYQYTIEAGETCEQRSTHRAAYPSRVLYNGGLMRVEFSLGSRIDLYAPSESTRCPSHFLQTKKLDEIRVYVQEQPAWKYIFSYDYSTYDDRLDDGVQKGKLTLKKVQKCGWDGANWVCLPETTFEYYPLGTVQNPQVGRNRLKSVSNGYGGKVAFTYQVVSEINGFRNRVIRREVDDGLSQTPLDTWAYSYDTAQRNSPYKAGTTCQGLSPDAGTARPRTRPSQEFRGHAWVQVTDPLGNVQVHYFYQDDIYKGKEYETDYYAGNSVLLRKVVNTYTYEQIAVDSWQGGYTWAEPEVAFTYISQEQDQAYRGDGTYQEKKTTYGYDPTMQGGAQYGNLTWVQEYDGNNPYRTTRRWYCPNPGLWIVDRMNAEGVWVGDWGEMASVSWYYYDQETSHLTCPQSKGELKRVQRLLPDGEDNDYLYWKTSETAYTYDDYGNRTSETVYAGYGQTRQRKSDYFPERVAWPTLPRTTQIDYNFSGSGFYLYPERVVYPISGLEERAAYNYRLGVLLSYTDFNGDTTSWEYDALGRVVKVYRPGDVAGYPSVQVDYLFFGTVGQQRVVVYRRTESSPSGELIWEERFFDGLGRLVQVHERSQGDGYLDDEVRKSTSYDAFGRVKAEWVPYYGDHGQDGGYGMYGYVPPDPNGARTQTSYDALGRVYNVVNPDGTVVKTRYNGWQVAVIDENGHMVIRESDALGRLIRVKEYLGAFGEPNWEAVPYATTSYTYDVRDLLTGVVDAAGNGTQVSYDWLGRKVEMSDPDMGTWSYTYDALGNMTRQGDARGQYICFYYDEMNRLLGKHYRNDDACPDPQSVTYNVRYTYDQGTNGKGRRTRMDDASGYTTWTYDDRGRVTQETKVVSGGGTFVTQWGYDALDRVAWMKYPGGNGGQVGEQVNYTYNTRGLLSGVVGYASYVQSQAYDAPGRVTERLLGNGLKTVYAYYPWTTPNGRGRLEWLKTGNNSPNYDSVQKLWYGYDGVGNVLTIRDYKDFMPPYTFYQEQAFTYDDLNRLTSARANGGQYGNYGPENYTYNAIGNLQSKAGMGYTYPASGVGSVHPHGVRRVNGSGGSTKTVTVRAKGVYYSGWPQMKLYVNGTFRCQWTVNSSSYTNYSCNTLLSGDDVVEVVYTNDVGSRALWVDYVVVDGLTVQAEGGAAVVDWGSENAAFDGLNVVVGQKLLSEDGALRLVKGAKAMALGYDPNGNMTSRVVEGLGYVASYDAENRLVQVTKSGGVVANFVYDGDGKRVKGEVGGVATTYIGDYYEWTGSVGTMKSTYAAGGVRVAVRVGNQSGTVYYLLTDHLGSTAVVANASGAKVGEVRYKAWGEERPACANPPCGTIPTTYRYTGQRWESGIGLYFYNARWYDPALGRFVQPDLLVKPENPQSLNRFSYVLNNPLRYADPSGNEATVQETAAYIYWRWGIKIVGENWQRWELDWIIRGLVILTEAVGGEAALKDLLGISAGKFVQFERIQDPNGIARTARHGSGWAYRGSVVQFYDQTFAGDKYETRGNPQFTAYTVIHELAHVMDNFTGGAYSKGFWEATEGGKETAYTEHGQENAGGGEDWAESLAGTLVPNVERVKEWQRDKGPPSQERQRYVRFTLGRSWYMHHDSWMWRRASYP